MSRVVNINLLNLGKRLFKGLLTLKIRLKHLFWGPQRPSKFHFRRYMFQRLLRVNWTLKIIFLRVLTLEKSQIYCSVWSHKHAHTCSVLTIFLFYFKKHVSIPTFLRFFFWIWKPSCIYSILTNLISITVCKENHRNQSLHAWHYGWRSYRLSVLAQKSRH